VTLLPKRRMAGQTPTDVALPSTDEMIGLRKFERSMVEFAQAMRRFGSRAR